ncbi:MAG: HEAT repeat domain-containing protein [Pseudobdellovibrionaceae bacterium]
MKIILASLIPLLVQQSQAALPPKAQVSSSMQALEILSLPEQNRNQLASQKGQELFPQLVQISKAKEQSMATRWKALTLAALVGKEKALPELDAALKSPEWFMRNAALISLRSYHPQKAKLAAQEALKDKALVVRSAAVEVLGEGLDRKTRDLFWEEYNAGYNFRKKQGLWIRSQILGHLAEKPESNERLLFFKALQDGDHRLHASAIGALEKLTQQSFGQPQIKLAEKRDLWLKWAKAHPQVITD